MSGTNPQSRTDDADQNPHPQLIKKKRDLRLADAYLRRLNVKPPPPRPVGAVARPTPQAVGGVVAGAAPVSMRPRWGDGVTIKKALKGDADKKTCLITVGTEDYVLKGAPLSDYFPPGIRRVDRDDRSTAADNAAAADLIRTLAIPGVRAPQSRAPDGREKAEVVAALTATIQAGGPMATDAQELLDSLNKGELQLSEVDPGGSDSDKVFIKKEVAAARDAACVVRRNALRSPDGGWDEALDRLIKTSDHKKKFAQFKGEQDLSKRREAIATIKGLDRKPTSFEYIKVLEEIVGGNVAAGLATAEKEIADRQIAMAELASFAKSDKGIAAYAGVAAADLITGMEDRIMNWNGGNFLFDARTQEIACVDNNKQPERGLTEKERPEQWVAFFETVAKDNPASLVDVLFDKLYKPDDFDAADKPAQMPGVAMDPAREAEAKKIIRDTLNDVVAKLKAPGLDGSAAAERGTVLETLLALQDIVAVPPHLLDTSGAAPDLSRGDKLLRGVQSLPGSWFAAATKVKDNLRQNPATYATARLDLAKLIAKHPKDSDGGKDRLAVNINFYANACEFGAWLNTAAAKVASIDTHARPAPPWTIYDQICQSACDAADKWLQEIGSEAQIVAVITTGKNALRAAG